MFSKEIFGLIAVGINSIFGANYIASIIRNKIKPHAFTWIVWCIISCIIFIAQYQQGAGAGAWTAGINTVSCTIISTLSLIKGEKNITMTDWIAFISALLIIPFWYFTQNAFLVVFLATLIDAFAYYPTIRKAWIKPYEEDFILYSSDIIKWVFALLAMGNYSLVTFLYPIFCMIANGGVAVMILLRRKRQQT